MGSDNWMITGLLLITAVLTASQLNDDGEAIASSVGTGSKVKLHCGDNSSGEYLELVLSRLDGIEERIADIQRRFTTLENNTSDMGDKISAMDNKLSTTDNKVSATEINMSDTYNKLSVTDNKVPGFESSMSTFSKLESQLSSAAADMSLVEPLISPANRKIKRMIACTNKTDVTDLDTVSKCLTMQLGVRNGHSVSEFKWIVEDFKSKRPKRDYRVYYSEPFYHTVPGYKFRLKGNFGWDDEIGIIMQLLPGEFDDQLRWPLSQAYDVTLLTKDGHEVPHKSSDEYSACRMTRPTYAIAITCTYLDPDWDDVWKNKKHILANDSIVIKLYIRNR